MTIYTRSTETLDYSNPAKPPVILLHGFMQTPASWRGAALQLRTAGHVVFTPSLTAESMDGCCALVENAVVELTDAAGVAPVLAGYSMGGRIAVETVTRTGGKLPISGLVLESAGLGPADQAERDLLERRAQEWADRVQGEGVEAFVDWWETLPLFESQKRLPVGARNRVRAERLTYGAERLVEQIGASSAHQQALETQTFNALKIASVRYPVHYIAGELDEKYRAVADRVQVEVPLAYVHRVAGAGHNVHLEKPSAFMSVLQTALASASS